MLSNYVTVSPSQTCTSTGLSKGVSAQCLFDLLVSLEGETRDTLDALELVKAEKPLRSLGNTTTSTPLGPITQDYYIIRGCV